MAETAENHDDSGKTMVEKNIKQRILDVSDDDPNIHAIYEMGADDGIEYYLVIATKEYDGIDRLKIRYFAAHKHDAGNDTWMKNGLNARSSDALLEALADHFQAIADGRTKERDETILDDLSEELP